MTVECRQIYLGMAELEGSQQGLHSKGSTAWAGIPLSRDKNYFSTLSK